jgi:hypothetical protein
VTKHPHEKSTSECPEKLCSSVANYKLTIEDRNKRLDEISADICAVEAALATTTPGFEYRLKISETPVEESHPIQAAPPQQDGHGKPAIIACEYLSWRRQPSNRFRLCYELSLHEGFNDESALSPELWRLNSTPFKSAIRPLIECKANLRVAMHEPLSNFVNALNRRAQEQLNRPPSFDEGMANKASYPIITDGYFLGEVIGE